MRIALFGGTFDPPHRAHVMLAKAAADQFELDTVFFAPTGRQPLKRDSASTSFTDRLTMVALTCAEDQRFAVSNLDAPRSDGEANYTVRTLGLLTELIPDAQVFNLVGADSFRDLARWREPRRLLQLAEWIVASRPGFALSEPEGMALSDAEWARIHWLDSVHEDVAATGLRVRLQEGASCEDLLPPAVAAYIRQHGLYVSAQAGLEDRNPVR